MDMASLLELAEMLHAGTINRAGYDDAAGKLDDTAAEVGPPPEESPEESAGDLTAGEASSDDAPHDGSTGEAEVEGKAMDMADDTQDTQGMAPEAPAVRPHGYEMMSRAHKGLHAWRKAVEADMGALDNDAVRQHMAQHVDGVGKALKAMKACARKTYKDHDEFPDDYADEAPLETKDLAGVDMDDTGDMGGMDMQMNAVDGGMSALDGSEGGALVGERPEDEEAMDGMDGMEGEEEMSDEDADYLAKSLPALKRQWGLA